MADQFIGEIRVFPFNFAPSGWALCNGQLLPISQNTALFSLLGTMYGGNGTSNFALPNLQGRAPMSSGQGPGLSIRDQGELGGEQTVTLLVTEIPTHTHTVQCGVAGNTASPANATFGGAGRGRPPAYAAFSSSAAVTMSASAVAQTGSSQPHDNMPPYLGLNFCIALTGIFPPRG